MVHWDRTGIRQGGSHLLFSCGCDYALDSHVWGDEKLSQEQEPHLVDLRLFTTTGAGTDSRTSPRQSSSTTYAHDRSGARSFPLLRCPCSPGRSRANCSSINS